MNRVVRTVILSAFVITVVTAALAMAETGRYPSAKQIPTVQTNQRASAEATVAPEIAPVAIVAAAPATKAEPKSKSGAGSTAQTSGSTKKTVVASTSSSKESDDSHSSEREVVNHKVRDESDEHSSDSGDSRDLPKSSSDSKKSSGDQPESH